MIEFECLSESVCIKREDIEDILAILRANGVPEADVSAERVIDVTRNSVVMVARDASDGGRRTIVGVASLARIATLRGTVGFIESPWIDPRFEHCDLPEDLEHTLVERGFALGIVRIEAVTLDKPTRRRRAHRSSFIRGIIPLGEEPKKPASK